MTIGSVVLVLAGPSPPVTVESNMVVTVFLTQLTDERGGGSFSLVSSSGGPGLVPLKQKVFFRSLRTLLYFKPPSVSACC